MKDNIISMSAPQIPRMVSIKEAAAITGLAEYHVRQLCIKGEITAVQTGRKWLVNVDRFIDYLNAPPAAAPHRDNRIRRIAE